MNPRIAGPIWQGFAQPVAAGKLGFAMPDRFAPNAGGAAVCGTDHECEFAPTPFLNCRPPRPPGGPDLPRLPGSLGTWGGSKSQGRGDGYRRGDGLRSKFPFLSRANKVDSGSIKTRARGFAVCVSPPFFWRQQPLSPSRAVSAMTPIRPPIMPLCAPLAVPLLALSSPMQPAAAKPKAHWLARWLVACLAAFRACRPATDTTSGLTAPRLRGDCHTQGHSGAFPRVAFLHFAPRALLKRGCYV